MTKKDIIKTISEQIGLTQLQTKGIVQMLFNSIVETLVTERRIELRNFGVFEVKRRAARIARNPQTDEKVVTGRFKTSHWEALQNQPILLVLLM